MWIQPREWRGVLGITGAVIALLSMAAWNPGPTRALSAPGGMFLLQQADCSAECVTDECEGDNHAWITAGDYEGWVDDPEVSGHECTWGGQSCAGHQHEECGGGPSEEDLDRLLVALDTWEGAAIQELIDLNGTRVSWNQDRQAVQVRGCGGKIATSIGLADRQVRALNDG